MVYQVKSKSELEAKIREAGDTLVIVDFFANWCGPCKRMKPVVDKLAMDYGDKLVFLKVDVDAVEDLVGEYGIEIMPTFVFKRKGEVVDTLVGSNEEKLAELIEKLLES